MYIEALKFVTSFNKSKVKYAEIGKLVSKLSHRNFKT